ncbi:radical SAM protein [Candidatus Poribacteria bacterium]|nr:radical SAM protein [Candidatus Poribacteria bacterium]
MDFLPSYIKLNKTGELKRRVEMAWDMLRYCKLCARECGVNRLEGETGFCRSDDRIVVANFGRHFGEEAPLVGNCGSGTMFLANCNLSCVYCQNYDISQTSDGEEMGPEHLARIMITLQVFGCHNVNFVSPTHYVPQILKGLLIAVESGLEIPLVYNCGGYESFETLKILDGIFDIYMPDIKYGDNGKAEKYSNAPGYFDAVKTAVSEMHRQVGDLVINSEGIAEKGLLIRHLVLPNNLSGTKKLMEFISGLSENSYMNIMDQYRPEYKAWEYPELSRRITSEEYEKTIMMAEESGLKRGFGRGLGRRR